MSLSSIDIVTIVAAIVVVLAYAYATFWALNIRRNLKVRLYRHQALGIGLVAICAAYFTFFNDGGGNYLPAAFSEYPITDIVFFSFLACLAPLLYLTDSSILAARDSDPLQRDVLGWGRIRIPLWGALAACLVGGGAYVVYQTIFLSQQTALAGNTVYLIGLPDILMPLQAVAIIVPLVVPPVSAVIFLSVAARRTRDLTLRKHLKWFGLGAAFFGVGALVNVLLTPLPFLYPVNSLILFVSSAYSFYRSARATIPMYSITEKA